MGALHMDIVQQCILITPQFCQNSALSELINIYYQLPCTRKHSILSMNRWQDSRTPTEKLLPKGIASLRVNMTRKVWCKEPHLGFSITYEQRSASYVNTFYSSAHLYAFSIYRQQLAIPFFMHEGI